MALFMNKIVSFCLEPKGSISNGNTGNAVIKKVVSPPGPRKELRLTVTEPGLRNDGPSLNHILDDYLHTLTERVKYHIGYPVNICYDHHATLAPLLQFHLNNCGDPFMEHPVDFHSKDFEVAVLDWFANLWEIERDQYWGYVTHGGTEGNLHGILIGRELHPNGILYASKDSHYSVFKAARMYRMDTQMINSAVNGEMDYSDLREKLFHNKDKPAIINANIGTTFKGAIDNIDIILQTLRDCGYSHDRFYIHCDAALFGLITPFVQNVSISHVLCSRHLYLQQNHLFSAKHLPRLCSVINADNHAYKSPEFQNSPLDQKGTADKDENSQTESPTSNKILTRLRRYGVAGVLSYGLLNTAYYLTTFLIVWFYVAPSPGKMGYLAAAERFLKVMAMVWAGSQVTKLVRAGGALALAPFVDRGLSWFTTKMKFESQGKAFIIIAGVCFGLAFMLFLIVTLLWA